MGADTEIANTAGETPRDIARRFAQLACVKLLGGDPGETMPVFFVFFKTRFPHSEFCTQLLLKLKLFSLMIFNVLFYFPYKYILIFFISFISPIV